MSLPLHIRAEAGVDMEEAARWYEQQRGGLGHAFLDSVEAALRAIAEAPSRYPALERGVRRALLQRFPFGVFYLVETRRIVVLAVMHGSRDPQHWQGRA